MSDPDQTNLIYPRSNNIMEDDMLEPGRFDDIFEPYTGSNEHDKIVIGWMDFIDGTDYDGGNDSDSSNDSSDSSEYYSMGGGTPTDSIMDFKKDKEAEQGPGPITVAQGSLMDFNNNTAVQIPIKTEQEPINTAQEPITAVQNSITATQNSITAVQTPITAVQTPITAVQTPITAVQESIKTNTTSPLIDFTNTVVHEHIEPNKSPLTDNIKDTKLQVGGNEISIMDF